MPTVGVVCLELLRGFTRHSTLGKIQRAFDAVPTVEPIRTTEAALGGGPSAFGT